MTNDMEVRRIKLKDLEPNTGQIAGLPSNPRQWTATEVRKIAKSLKETPELFEARPIIVIPHGGKHVILGGNLRYEGCRFNKDTDAPCVVVPEGTPVAKLKEIVVKDNGAFGSWDYDALANEWDDLPLVDWGVPVWETAIDKGLSTEGRQGGEGYEDFVNKFDEEIPLTTDDCYTPPEVYDLVRDFVDKNVAPLSGRKIVRPFYPGGDYEKESYPKGCAVIDNPPFSLYSKIVRFYIEKGIDFFLFGPQLSLIVGGADVCFCAFNTVITYENGAKVNTGFVTNMRKGVRIWVEHSLRDAIMSAQKTEPTTAVYEYPDVVISSALLGKVANCGELELMSDECSYIHNLDAFKDMGKGLFGGGFLLSNAGAKKVQAAAEKARAAAEKARAVKIELSPREKAIVAELDKMTAERLKVS